MQPIYCPVRKSWCKALPEEEVRISLINKMVHQLGFPLHSLAVEKELSGLPHIPKNIPIPERRADILCFVKGIHPSYDIYPLLMVECKAVKITPKVLAQVTGYNVYVQAYFVCAANQEEIQTGWRNSTGSYEFAPLLPTYQELKDSILFYTESNAKLRF